MKNKIIIPLCLLLMISLSCNKNQFATNSPLLSSAKPNLKAVPKWGIWLLNGDPTLISQSGPTGSGWTGIGLYAGLSMPSDSFDFAAASKAGYTILAQLQRDSIRLSRWSYVKYQIAWGKNHGAWWFYVDDALSEPVKTISKSQIDSVAMFVHASPSQPLVTAEYSQSRMQANPTWHQNVDIIMPYQYSDSLASQYQSFLQFVSTNYPTKGLFPLLGYHADNTSGTGPAFWPNQTGAYPDYNGKPGTGHIAVAEAYSTGMIFYYTYWNGAQSIPWFNSVTSYLREYYGM